MRAGRTLSESIAARTQRDDEQAEVLEWIGSTYGQRPDAALGADADGIAQALADLEALDSGGPVSPNNVVKRSRRSRTPLLVLGVALIAAATVQWWLVSKRSVLRDESHPAAEQAKAKTALSSEPAVAVAAPAAQQPVSSPSAPTTPDTAAPQPTPEADTKAPAQEADNRAAAEHEATKKETGQNPQVQHAAKETPSDQASTAAPEPVTPPPPATQPAPEVVAVPAQQSPAESPPDVTPAAKTVSVQVTKTAIAPSATKVETAAADLKKTDAPASDMATGQALLADGKLAAARRSFEKAVQSGLPEGALALGNTYDPMTLEKLGLNDKGNPSLARHWYRRAHEIARQHP